MGVPKFYRWLSERYPQINVVLSDNSLLPEFDNMYLDMNGIIHACTHPNDNDAANHEIAKPKKILFMAIDGCAPRAKLNQQRARRFRSAQERMESIKKAKSDGEILDEAALFDSNCITPGTEFMEQIKEDPLWRNLEVVFSGHDVPGEGEHKIMQYIRDLRARPDYQPNTRHCMYGGDADLIMLGLATHEPHFCLLREVVNFNRPFGNKGGARQVILKQTQEAKFQLMHLSMVREYVELDLALGCGYQVDKERLVDDFIFLTFLVGNDFLPHLPTLDIGEHAFDVLFGAYKQLLSESPGFLVTAGELQDMARLEALFRIIGKQEHEILEKREEESKNFKGHRGMSKAEITAQALAIQEALASGSVTGEAAATLSASLAPANDENSAAEDDSDDEDGFVGAAVETHAKNYRGRYYFEKFSILPETSKGSEFLTELTDHYMQGLMWCLAYYIKGCISWTWYYPYNYGPMLVDMVDCDVKQARISFELGAPFTPFQQLLGCLPPLSKKLLPTCYQWLMSAEDSPCLEFYPNDFEVDQNGKKTPWEAVSTHCPAVKLTKDEVERNSFGNILVYRYEPSVTENYLSCNPEIVAPDFNCGHPFYPEVVEGTISPIAGYPSLGVLPIVNVEKEFFGVNVFGMKSRYQTICLEYQQKKYNPEKLDISKLLGRHCWCNYPSMHEARVVAVTDCKQEYRIKNGDIIHTPHAHLIKEKWGTNAREEEKRYVLGGGVPGSAGMSIGEIELFLHVVPLQGMRKDPVSGALKKVFGTKESAVPLQLVLWKDPVPDSRFIEQEEQTVAQLFPLGSSVISTVGQFRGMKGRVVGYRGGKVKGDTRSVDVELVKTPPEPPFGYIIQASVQEDYYSSYDICKALRISSQVLGRIVGALFVDHPSRADLGLNLKRNNQYALQGYVRKVDKKGSVWERHNSVKVIGTDLEPATADSEDRTRESWEYSARTVNLLLEYKASFPNLFANLGALPFENGSKFTPNDLFGKDGEHELKRCVAWLSSQPVMKMARIPVSTKSLEKPAIRAIERAADVRTAYLAACDGGEKITLSNVPLDALYREGFYAATEHPGTLNSTAPRLGDRVVNISSTGVPFGLRGTVITIHEATGYVDVLFDEEFLGGRPLQDTCSNFRGRLCPWSGVLCVKKSEQLISADPSIAASILVNHDQKKPQSAAQLPETHAKQTSSAPKKAPAQKKGKSEAEVSNDMTSMLKSKLSIGSTAPAPAVVPPPAPAPEEVVPRNPITIKESDGTGRAALEAMADGDVDVLSELPIEPPMAGVLQYLPISTAPVRAQKVVPQRPRPENPERRGKPKSTTAKPEMSAEAKEASKAAALARIEASAAKDPEARKETAPRAASPKKGKGKVVEAGDKKKPSGKALLAALRAKAVDKGSDVPSSPSADKKPKKKTAPAPASAPAEPAPAEPAPAEPAEAENAKKKVMVPARLLLKKRG
eukprot:GSChrysophyteH1.ASY1.ANO1.2467.1 assembled CDS